MDKYYSNVKCVEKYVSVALISQHTVAYILVKNHSNVKFVESYLVHEIHVYSVNPSQLGILSLESVCDSKSNFETT